MSKKAQSSIAIYTKPFMTNHERILLIIIVILIVCVRVIYDSNEFADFNGYVSLLDSIVFNKWSVWSYGDPLSWGVLVLFRDIFGDSYSAVQAGNLYVSVLFIVFTYTLLKYYAVSWQSILLIFATFGPLLAFITIRATPAYFLVTIATLEASRGRWRWLFVFAIAVLFHSSALLALPSLVAAIMQRRFSILDRAFTSRSTILFVSVGIISPLIFFREYMLDLTRYLIIILGSTFAKFSIYLQGGSTNSVEPIGSIYHQIYFSISSLALIAFLLKHEKAQFKLGGYLLVSYGIYVFMFSVPPSAFRQSLFWMMPLMIAFPWREFSFRGVGSTLLPVIAVVLFWYGFRETLV